MSRQPADRVVSVAVDAMGRVAPPDRVAGGVIAIFEVE